MLFNKEEHRQELLRIIKTSFADPIEVWAYGSRVNGTSHDASDLDIVIRNKDLTNIDAKTMNVFLQSVKASNIPFLIDIKDWARLPENFHREILQKHEVIYSHQ